VKIILVVGARPNFMKIAPIVEAISRWNEENDEAPIQSLLVHTGQHYDQKMSDAFFHDLGIPFPDIDLEVGSASHAVQTAEVMIRFEKVCLQEKPDWVLVVGDVNSTMAATLVAVKMGIKVCHVEAGLRSGDRSMPEEINRLVTDAIADLLFTTSRDADENLFAEGVAKNKIHFVGNVMIDTLFKQKDKLPEISIPALISGEQKYGVVTLHRPSNVDDERVFKGIASALKKISDEIPLIFPIHPRTKKRLEEFGLTEAFHELDVDNAPTALTPGIHTIPPLGYHAFLNLWKDAAIVLTDSGGLQEETTALGVPCLTLRENTERPVTIWEGTNILVGVDPDKIVREAKAVLDGSGKKGGLPEFWDGKAAQRIINVLVKYGKNV